jgi:hypothetical protein
VRLWREREVGGMNSMKYEKRRDGEMPKEGRGKEDFKKVDVLARTTN